MLNSVSIPHRQGTTTLEGVEVKYIGEKCQFLIGKVQLLNVKLRRKKILLNVSIPHRQGTTKKTYISMI